ncbi:MAG: ATP-binding protein [Spartobacteria bacterium]|nr:ATP-binding protein [Spartobacteria bacterium]
MSAPGNEHYRDGLVTLLIPYKYSYLRIVRQAVSDVCVHAGLSEFKAAELEMAIDEACSSIIERCSSPQNIQRADDWRRNGLKLNLLQKVDSVVIEIYDYGPGIDFEHEKAVDPEHYANDPKGPGLGVYVIKRFVDDIHYEPNTHDGNYLRLTKRL